MRAIRLVVLLAFASPAMAQEGMYVGLGFGAFDYSESSPGLAPEPFEDTVSAWKLYGGFELNEHFAFEIRYGATGKIKQTLSGTDPTYGDFTATFGTDSTITTVLGMGMWPKDWGTPFGGIGYFDSSGDTTLALTTQCCGPFNQSLSISDNGLAAALGIEWRFLRFGSGVALRLEYEWLDADNANASTIGIGIAYRF